MERCRVLELLGGSLTDGGAETLVKDYVYMLDKSAFDTAVFVDWTIAETANTQIMKSRGDRIYSVYPKYDLFWRVVNRFFRKYCFRYRLRKIISSFHPDVIHIHLNALEYLSGLGKEIDGIRLLYTCHSDVSQMFGPRDMENVEAKSARELIRKRRLKLIALHSAMKAELSERFDTDDVIVLNNGIDLERFRDILEDKDTIRESFGIPKDSFVMGHVGRFSHEKNHLFIVDVFESVHKVNKNSFLLLVGSGILLEKVRQTLSEKGLDGCSMILSNRTDVQRLLKAMDVFVFPSIYEGFSVSLLEAQAAGLRCVVADSIDNSSFVTDLVVPLGLADGLERWRDSILDVSVRSGFTNRLYEFDSKFSIKKLEKIYLGKL